MAPIARAAARLASTTSSRCSPGPGAPRARACPGARQAQAGRGPGPEWPGSAGALQPPAGSKGQAANPQHRSSPPPGSPPHARIRSVSPRHPAIVGVAARRRRKGRPCCWCTVSAPAPAHWRQHPVLAERRRLRCTLPSICWLPQRAKTRRSWFYGVLWRATSWRPMADASSPTVLVGNSLGGFAALAAGGPRQQPPGGAAQRRWPLQR